jgi:O-antigen ligase
MKKFRTILSTIAVILIFTAGSIIGVIDVFVPQEPRIKTLMMIVTLLLATAALVIVSPRSRSYPGGIEGVALTVFLVMTIFSCLLSQLSGERYNATDMWRYAILALIVTVSFWGCYAWAATRFRVGPIDTGVLIIALICMSSVMLEARGLISYETYGNRFFGFMGDNVAWLLSFSAIYLLVRQKYFLLAFCVLALLLTQSRGALIVFIAGGFLFLAKMTTTKKHKIYYLIGIIAIYLLFVFLAPELLRNVFSRFSETDFFDNDRSRTNAFSLSVFEANPLAGSGYGAHTYAFESTVFRKMRHGKEMWAIPVSTWLQVLADSGLLGFIPFVVFIMLVMRAALRTLHMRLGGSEHQALVGLSIWLLAFLFLNHSAPWLLPGSYLSTIVFAAAGLVVGARSWPQGHQGVGNVSTRHLLFGIK